MGGSCEISYVDCGLKELDSIESAFSLQGTTEYYCAGGTYGGCNAIDSTAWNSITSSVYQLKWIIEKCVVLLRATIANGIGIHQFSCHVAVILYLPQPRIIPFQRKKAKQKIY